MGSVWRQWDGWNVGKPAQPNVPEGSSILRISNVQAGEQRQAIGHYGCIILWTSRGCQNLFWKKERSSMGYVEDVSPGWEQRKKWKSFSVSFWGSIISPHTIQGVPGSLPVFSEQLLLFAFLQQCEKGEYGLGFGGVLTKKSQESLSKKVSGGMWLTCRCPYELIPQKGSWSKYYVNFSGISCAGSQTEEINMILFLL